jgi:ribonuclease HI
MPDSPDWFIDGSSYKDPPHHAGYAIILAQNKDPSLPSHKVIEALPLPPQTSSQQAELIVLTQALTLAQEKISIYTDSKYAYIIHSNILIWRERGFLTQCGNPIINGDLIEKLLNAAMLPSQASIVHCREHQRDGQ